MLCLCNFECFTVLKSTGATGRIRTCEPLRERISHRRLGQSAILSPSPLTWLGYRSPNAVPNSLYSILLIIPRLTAKVKRSITVTKADANQSQDYPWEQPTND
jgi:hypothetical protein